MAVAHYLEALDWQREFIRIHAVLGGKNPHLQSFLVGGMATPVDPDSQAAINVTSIASMREMIANARDFVTRVYLPDLLAVASFYKDWAGFGAGVGNYMAYGEYPEGDEATAALFLPRGIIRGRDISKVEPLDPAKITEFVTHSWYDYAGGDDASLHPFDGETQPHYTGPEPPYERLDTDGKYSWLKSPRYDGEPMEVGPLARMLVAYVSGHQRVQGAGRRRALPRSASVRRRSSPPSAGSPPAASRPWCWPRRWTTGSPSWPTTWAAASWRSTTTRSGTRRRGRREATGAGFHEAPRGALGHWVHIKDGAIANYQCIVPSTWNAGPRDGVGKRGPYEEALLGTPVADPEQPHRDPAHRPLLRPLHGLRRARRGPGGPRADPGEGGMNTVAGTARAPRFGRVKPVQADLLCLANVYVWEWPVRVTHWLTAGSFWVLSLTGIYMGYPLLIVAGEANQHFVMGTAKLIHFYAAIVFTLSVLSRIVWMFIGNKYARWDKFLPVTQDPPPGTGARPSSTTSSASASRPASSATTRWPG